MSNIHNPQRRALESLVVKDIAVPFILKENQRYYIDYAHDKEIFLLGISRGIGTCSDLKDVNIAVFGHKKPEAIRWEAKFPEQCAAAAIIRETTEAERPNAIQYFLIADNLKFAKEIAGSIHFIRQGASEPYAPTIC